VYLLLPKGTSVLWYPSEKFFLDPNNGNKKEYFTGIDELAEVELSLVVPAYNESPRLPSICFYIPSFYLLLDCYSNDCRYNEISSR
jgi:hypothetical protein